MKILQIIDKHGYGGIQQVAQQLSELLVGHDIETYEYLRFDTQLKPFKWVLIFFSLLKKVIADFDFVLIHSPFILLFSPIFRIVGKKVIYCMHGPHVMFPNSTFDFLGYLRCFVMLFITKIVLVSSGQISFIPKFKRPDCRVINNIPKLYFNKFSENEKISQTSNYIVYCHVARICDQKNQEFSLLVQKELLKLDGTARLVLIGSGNESELINLIEIANTYGLRMSHQSNNNPLDLRNWDVIVIGPIKSLADVLDFCNTLIFPSRYEGYPLAVVEGLILGFEVVSTDCQTGPIDIKRKIDSDPEISNLSNFEILPPVFDEIHARLWAESVYKNIHKERKISDFQKRKLMSVLANQDEFINQWSHIFLKK